MTDRTEQVRRLAEGVMGWTHAGLDTDCGVFDHWHDSHGKCVPSTDLFDPFTNAAHTEMVMDRMRDLGWWLDINIHLGRFTKANFFCCFGPCSLHGSTNAEEGHEGSATADDWRTAVCLAALEAVNAGN